MVELNKKLKELFMFDLRETAKEHIIVTAHRGKAGGNIPCNTMASYQIALKEGADIIEIDVAKSLDGELFLFHPGMELAHLGLPFSLNLLPSSIIKKIPYRNSDGVKTQFNITTFDDFLEEFKDKCFINVDKFWSAPKKIYEKVKAHNMIDQVLVKSRPSKKVFDILENIAPELPYMPIVRNSHEYHDTLIKANLNYVGVEVLFNSEDSPLLQPEFIERMKKDNILLWSNTIVFNKIVQLSAGHSDDTALTASEDNGWGWHVDHGFDIIQTDWPMLLIDYLKRTNKYYK